MFMRTIVVYIRLNVCDRAMPKGTQPHDIVVQWNVFVCHKFNNLNEEF